jgi:hypothetical protein
LPFETAALNPTSGVTVKQPLGLEYKKDPTRPGGGVFVARGEAKKRDEDLKDVPEGVVIRGSSDDELEVQGISSAPPISDERGRGERGRASMMSSSAFAPPLPQSDIGVMGVSSPASSSTASSGSASDVRGLSLLQSAIRNTRQMQPGKTPGLGHMVNFSPLSGAGVAQSASLANMNPAMNSRGPAGSNQVQVMNVLDGQTMGGTLADFAMVDTGFLEGIPGGMFDWSEYAHVVREAKLIRFSGQWDTFFSRFNNAGLNGGENSGSASNLVYSQQPPSMQQRP